MKHNNSRHKLARTKLRLTRQTWRRCSNNKRSYSNKHYSNNRCSNNSRHSNNKQGNKQDNMSNKWIVLIWLNSNNNSNNKTFITNTTKTIMQCNNNNNSISSNSFIQVMDRQVISLLVKTWEDFSKTHIFQIQPWSKFPLQNIGDQLDQNNYQKKLNVENYLWGWSIKRRKQIFIIISHSLG